MPSGIWWPSVSCQLDDHVRLLVCLVQPVATGTDREVLTYPELRRLEKDNLLAALEKCAWKVAGSGGAAEILNANPSTLASRIKVLGISPEHNN